MIAQALLVFDVKFRFTFTITLNPDRTNRLYELLILLDSNHLHNDKDLKPTNLTNKLYTRLSPNIIMAKLTNHV